MGSKVSFYADLMPPQPPSLVMRDERSLTLLSRSRLLPLCHGDLFEHQNPSKKSDITSEYCCYAQRHLYQEWSQDQKIQTPYLFDVWWIGKVNPAKEQQIATILTKQCFLFNGKVGFLECYYSTTNNPVSTFVIDSRNIFDFSGLDDLLQKTG